MKPEIIDLTGTDRQIDAPGFYRIEIERHHNQPCTGPSVTSSTLRTIQNKTPADVWAFHPLNENRYEQPETRALVQGRAMAAMIEGGPDLLREQFVVLDADSPRRPTAQQIAAYEKGKSTDAGKKSVEFWAGVGDGGFITETEAKLIFEMGLVLRDDAAAMATMDGEAEITMAWHDAENDLWVLSRPDTVHFDGIVTDYKKIASQGRPFDARMVDRRITDHGYHMQMALAVEAFEALTGGKPQAVGVIAQCSEPPYHVILREIASQEVEIGTFQNRRARRIFRECLDAGHWPGPGEAIGTYHMPDWYREATFVQMAEEGQTPQLPE